MRIEQAKSGMILTEDIIDDRSNLLLEKGMALTERYIHQLKRLGFTLLPAIDPQAPVCKPAPVISTGLRRELTSCFRTLFAMKTAAFLTPKLQKIQIRQIHQTTDRVISEIETNLPQILSVQVRQPDPDEVNHAINVCLLSVITGFGLKLSRPVLSDLAMGALLHDLGKSILPMVDHKLVNSPRLHTLYGKNLLLNHKLHPVIARIAAEHHEMYDGSGYPLGLTGSDMHPLSRIVAVANYFDNALKQAETGGTPRQEVVEDMLASGNTQFDLKVLRTFLHTVTIHPVGSLICLNTGQQAYVLENHPQSPLRPLIRMKDETAAIIDLIDKPTILITGFIEE
ncbi:MAG: HD domain-containing phosphohydrolase [Veillonellales bacterium]